MSKLRKRMITVLLSGIMSVALLAGCSSGATTKDSSAGASQETALEDAAAAATEESISQDDLKAGFNDTVPYDGEVQVIAHLSSGEDVVLNSTSGEKVKDSMLAVSANNRKWIGVTGAWATTTLSSGKYSYSVWNMLDWDPKTCWAEGESRSEGLWEGFSYYFDGVKRIDGFRIYPGYQKSKSVYRNNILPRGLTVSAGGYEIDCDLDFGLQDITRDGDWYWLDIVFSKPAYDDDMYTMISAVGTYGNDPDKDCCISEFHPFSY